MIPPQVSFITWNRLGLTDRNLNALFKTADDFELYLADNNSQDDTWEYLKDLSDPRIKLKTRFDSNRGPVYATNYHLSLRKNEQYFITLDSDVNIHTSNWISKFIETFQQFPEVGLLGAVSWEYLNRNRQVLVKKEMGSACYLQIVKCFVEGCCQCLRPQLLDQLGYWNEECCMGDVEICYRICNHTSFKAGFIPTVEIDQLQFIPCGQCGCTDLCSLKQEQKSCFDIHDEKYSNPQFRNMYRWKYGQYLKELDSGKREVYCSSIHDAQSMEKVYYNRHSAEENFKYYMDNAN